MDLEINLRSSQELKDFLRNKTSVTDSGIESSEDPYLKSNVLILIVAAAILILVIVLLLKRIVINFKRVVLGKYDEEKDDENVRKNAGESIGIPAIPLEGPVIVTNNIDQRYNPSRSTTVDIPYYPSGEDKAANTDQSKQPGALSINLDHVLDRANKDSIQISSKRSVKGRKGSATRSSHNKSRATGLDENYIKINFSPREGKSLPTDKTKTGTSLGGMVSKTPVADAKPIKPENLQVSRTSPSAKKKLESAKKMVTASVEIQSVMSEPSLRQATQMKQEVSKSPLTSTEGLQIKSESNENLYGPSTMSQVPSRVENDMAPDEVNNATLAKEKVSLPPSTLSEKSQVDSKDHENRIGVSRMSRDSSDVQSDSKIGKPKRAKLVEQEVSMPPLTSSKQPQVESGDSGTKDPVMLSLPTEVAKSGSSSETSATEKQIRPFDKKSTFRKTVNKIKLVQKGFSLGKEHGSSGKKIGEAQQQMEEDSHNDDGFSRLAETRRSSAGSVTILQDEISNNFQAYFQ